MAPFPEQIAAFFLPPNSIKNGADILPINSSDNERRRRLDRVADKKLELPQERGGGL